MATGYGLYDMAGNIYEWSRSKAATTVEQYPQIESLTNALHDLADTQDRVIRGGGWGAGASDNPSTSIFRCYSRTSRHPTKDYGYNSYNDYGSDWGKHDLGFRVVRRSLSVDPTNAVVTVTQVFDAVGGVPPFAWSVESSVGSINPSTGYSTTYTRLSSGNNTITCTDAAGLSASATISQP